MVYLLIFIINMKICGRNVSTIYTIINTPQPVDVVFFGMAFAIDCRKIWYWSWNCKGSRSSCWWHRNIVRLNCTIINTTFVKAVLLKVAIPTCRWCWWRHGYEKVLRPFNSLWREWTCQLNNVKCILSCCENILSVYPGPLFSAISSIFFRLAHLNYKR